MRELAPRPPSGYYPFAVGRLRCLAISDGFTEFEVALLAPEVELGELQTYLGSRGHRPDEARTQFSCMLIRDRGSEQTVLIDAGIGSLPARGSAPLATAGRTRSVLEAADVTPAEIDVVLVSHLHPDHIGGLFDTEDRPVYPNAVYRVCEREARFWTADSPDLSGQLSPPPMRSAQIWAARRFVELASARTEFFAAGDEVLPGITAVSVPGHTQEQVGFRIESDGQTLLYTADALSHPLISIEHPEWRFGHDADSPTAVATRQRLVAELQAERTRIFTPHFPWPCLGRIGTVADRPIWTQEPYQWEE